MVPAGRVVFTSKRVVKVQDEPGQEMLDEAHQPSAAPMAPLAFQGAGRAPGVEKFLVRNLNAVKIDLGLLSVFHTGSAYVLLHTLRQEVGLVHGIHFWLGKASSPDDASTAAVLATTLQRLLGGAPRRYRELQGAESSLFRLARTRRGRLPHLPAVLAGARGSRVSRTTGPSYALQGGSAGEMRQRPLDAQALDARACFMLVAGGVVHVWRGAEAHRAAREGVEGLCRAHDALAALLRALLLPPGTPICLATQASLPSLASPDCALGGCEPEAFTRHFANWASSAPVGPCGAGPPAPQALEPSASPARRSEDAEEVGRAGLLAVPPLPGSQYPDSGFASSPSCMQEQPAAQGTRGAAVLAAPGAAPGPGPGGGQVPCPSPTNKEADGVAALPAIVAELTAALAAAPAARVLAVGPELPGALRELARALLQGEGPEGDPVGHGGDQRAHQRAQHPAKVGPPPAASGVVAPAGNAAAPPGEPALAAAAPGLQEWPHGRSGRPADAQGALAADDGIPLTCTPAITSGRGTGRAAVCAPGAGSAAPGPTGAGADGSAQQTVAAPACGGAAQAAAAEVVGVKSAAVAGALQPVVVPRLDLSRCVDGQRPGADSTGPDLDPAPEPGRAGLSKAMSGAEGSGLDVRACGSGAHQGPAAPCGGEEHTRAASLLRRALFPARPPAASASASRREPTAQAQPGRLPQVRQTREASGVQAQAAPQAPTNVALEPPAAPRGGRSGPRRWWRGLFGRAPEPWVDAAGVRWRHNAAAARICAAAPVLAPAPDLAAEGAHAAHRAAAGAGDAGFGLGPALGAPAPASFPEQGLAAVGAAAEASAGADPGAAPETAPPHALGAAVSHAPGGVAWRENAAAEAMSDAGGDAGRGSALSTLASSGADSLAAALQEPGGGAPAVCAAGGRMVVLEGCAGAVAAVPDTGAAAGPAHSAGHEEAPQGSVAMHALEEGLTHGNSGRPDVLCGEQGLLAGTSAAGGAAGGAVGGAAAAATPRTDPATRPGTAGAASPGGGGGGSGRDQPPSGGEAVDTLDLHANPMVGLDLGELLSTGGECVGRGRLSSAGEAFLAAMFEGAAPQPNSKHGTLGAARTPPVRARARAHVTQATDNAAQPPGSSADGRPGVVADVQGGAKAVSSHVPIKWGPDTGSPPRSAGAVLGSGGWQARTALEAVKGSAGSRAEGPRLPSTGSSAEGPWVSDWVLGPAPGPSPQGGLPQPAAEQHTSSRAVHGEAGRVSGCSDVECGAKGEAGTRQGKAAGPPAGPSPLCSSISIVASSSALPRAPAPSPMHSHSDPVPTPAGAPGTAAGRSMGRPPRSPERPQRRTGTGSCTGSSAATLASANPAVEVKRMTHTPDAAAGAALAGGPLGGDEVFRQGAGQAAPEQGSGLEDEEVVTPMRARVQQLNAQLQCAHPAGLGSGSGLGPVSEAAGPRRSFSDEDGPGPGTSPLGREGAHAEGTQVLGTGVAGANVRPPSGPLRCSTLPSSRLCGPQGPGPDPTPGSSRPVPGPVQAGAPSQRRERSPGPSPDPAPAGAPFACRVSPGIVAAAIAAGSLPLRRATAAGPDGAAVGRLVAVVPYAALRELRDGAVVDLARREEHLSDAEFAQVFHMDRAAFARLPHWRQVQAKRSAGLF